MTDKERIEILEKVKDEITNKGGAFICNELGRIVGLDFFIIFPELENHKPKDKRLHQAWFGGKEGKAIRLKVLNSMITEIKAKSND